MKDPTVLCVCVIHCIRTTPKCEPYPKNDPNRLFERENLRSILHTPIINALKTHSFIHMMSKTTC